MEKNIGIYICSGCEIGKVIDTEALKETIQKEYQPKVCGTHPFLCSAAGIDNIKDDIQKNDLKGVVIAACSSRIKTGIFQFEGIQNERVNLREQVAWCSNGEQEDIRMQAEDYLRMGIVKVANTSLSKPYIAEDLSSDILVVGGGISGISAAIDSAKAGYRVHLIEKEETIGGWTARLYKQNPSKPPYTELQEPEIKEKIEEVRGMKQVEILTSVIIENISGQPGDFNVSLKQKDKKINFKVAAIISAQGWKPYDPSKLGKYGYGKYKNVVTNVEFEQLAVQNQLKKTPDNKPLERVLFIQCAGSRDEEHLPYCSNFCCTTSLKQARYIRDLHPKAIIYIVYKDIRTPGKREMLYKEIQQDNRILFTKGSIQKVEENNGELVVEAKDTLIDEVIQINVDMVVLATGMTPAGTEDLQLDYRLGKGLPELSYHFPDSHFICFPYETRRTGIFAAGSVRAPMDITACKEDAAGAALKAIQTIEMMKRGEALHPRSGDTSYPQLYMERCTDCKRCTEECPFGMYDETEKGTPLPNPNRCRRCGICLGSCPERVISFEDFSINSVSAMIKSIHIPDEFEEKPRILAFVCENDAYPAIDMAGMKRNKISPYIRIIPVRCIGSVNKVWVSDALSQGFDGILQIGCKPGDDYQCHFIQGSQLTEERSENLQETLQSMMLEPERIKTEFVEINEFDRITDLINEYVETIQDMGPNPFKGL